MAVVTISREIASGGDGIARRVCELLGYRYFDKALMVQVAHEQGLSEAEVVDFSEDSYRVRGFIDALLRRPAPVASATVRTASPRGEEVRLTQVVDEETAAAFVAATIRGLRARGQVVVVGRGGQALLRNDPGVLHVRIFARLEDRVQQMMQAEGLTREAALDTIGERDRAMAQYLRRFHAIDWCDPSLYHLMLNGLLLGRETAAELIAAAAKRLGAGSGGRQPAVAG